MRADVVKLIALVLALAALVGFDIWARTSAPCDAFSFVSVKDVPARCIGR